MAKILLVEDNEMNRDMLTRRLQRRGYQVVLAVNGEEAVEKAAVETPDLILMDISLPVMSGLEATRLIRSQRGGGNAPIIALTANAMAEDEEEAMRTGCSDYDTKPVDMTRLLEKIEAALSKSEAANLWKGGSI